MPTNREQAQAGAGLPPGWRVTAALDCYPPGVSVEWKATSATKRLDDGTRLVVCIEPHSYERLRRAPAGKWKRPGDLVHVTGDAWRPGVRCPDFRIDMEDGSLAEVATIVDALIAYRAPDRTATPTATTVSAPAT